MASNRKYMLLGDLAVLLVAFIWGATNVVIRDALGGITPFWFCALRFIIAAAAVMLIFRRRAASVSTHDKIAGTFTGAVFIMAYLVGAVGLLYTTAGNQSFIISTSVVFVPLAVWFITRRFPGWHVIVAVIMCTVGTAGLVLDGEFSVNFGDLLSAAALFFVTVYILLVQKFVANADPCGLACWQAAGGMAVALAAALIFEPFPQHIPLKAWAAIIYAGTMGFALTLVLQTTAQKYTSSTHVAILLSTSGIFGSLLGIIFLGEPMTVRIFTASALIFAGIMLVELLPLIKERKRTPQR